MRGVESWLFTYVSNSLWQVPLLFAAAWLLARPLRAIGAAWEHRLWVGALLLQAVLPACPSVSWQWLRDALVSARAAGEGSVSVAFGPGAVLEHMRLPDWLLACVAVLYGVALLYFAARLAWRSWRIRVLVRGAVTLSLEGDALRAWTACCRHFDLAGGRHEPKLASSRQVSVPVTVGIRHRLILLPESFAGRVSNADLRTVLAHECAHVARHDFGRNLVYQLLSLPVSYHPCFWFTRARVHETREMICDHQAAAAFAGEQQYARSLLRVASCLVHQRSAHASHAIGFFDAHTFERRIMMLTQTKRTIGRFQKAVTLTACCGVVFVTCASALALRIGMPVSANQTAEAHPARHLVVPSKVMAGNVLSRPSPVYPQAAKKAKTQGTVIVGVTIDKEGKVQDAHVVSGPEDLRQATLDSVTHWVYKPYLLNGDPVEVQTTIHVTYSLGR